MAAALPKRHLVAVTQNASEFRLLVFYTLWWQYVRLLAPPRAGGALGDRLACLCLETVLILAPF